MNKILVSIFVLAMVSFGYSEDILGSVNASGTGSTSAAAYIPQAAGSVVKISDLSYRLDSGNTSGILTIRSGKAKWQVTSATTSTGTVAWYDASSAGSAAGDYLLHQDASAGTVTLYRISSVSSAATSASTYETLPILQVVDSFWTMRAAITRPCVEITTSGSMKNGDLWLPGREPSVLLLEGNTTACKISVSGIRLK